MRWFDRNQISQPLTCYNRLLIVFNNDADAHDDDDDDDCCWCVAHQYQIKSFRCWFSQQQQQQQDETIKNFYFRVCVPVHWVFFFCDFYRLGNMTRRPVAPISCTHTRTAYINLRITKDSLASFRLIFFFDNFFVSFHLSPSPAPAHTHNFVYYFNSKVKAKFCIYLSVFSRFASSIWLRTMTCTRYVVVVA